jgi:hypothetical protein
MKEYINNILKCCGLESEKESKKKKIKDLLKKMRVKKNKLKSLLKKEKDSDKQKNYEEELSIIRLYIKKGVKIIHKK